MMLKIFSDIGRPLDLIFIQYARTSGVPKNWSSRTFIQPASETLPPDAIRKLKISLLLL